MYAVFFVLLSSSALFGSPQTDSAELKGEVYDPHGLLIVNAQVRLLPAAQDSPGSTEFREAATDTQGRFEFRNLGPGAYRLRACAAGFQCEELPVQVRDTGTKIEICLPAAGVHQGVVVTATRREAETSETTLASALVPGRRLERLITLNLAQALETIPGVNWVNAGPFRSRPVIRGLDSNRVLVLVDGERLNNARTSTTNTGIESSLVDLSQIKQVEVVSGPGSVLYGSDALGGIVNIRTHTAAPTETLRFGARLRGEFFPNSDGRRTLLELSSSHRKWTARATGSLGSIDDYRSPAGPLYGSGVDESSALVDVRLYPANQHSIFGKFLHRGAYNFGVPSLESNPAFLGLFPFSKLQKFSGGYNGNFNSPWFSTLQVRFYRQEQPRDFFNDVTAPPDSHVISDTVTRVESSGFDVQATALASGRHYLTYGVNAYRDHSQETRLQVLKAGNVTTVLTRAPSVPNSVFSNVGVLFQDEFEWSRRLRLVGGIRFDRFRLKASETADFDPSAFSIIKESRTDTAWSGNLGASLTVRSNWTLTAHVARAFREPNLFERYFLGRGSLGNFFVPNPDLKPEASVQLDLGARNHWGPLRTSVNYFSNHLRDLITTAPGTFLGLSVRRGEPVRQNVNVNRARIQGIESMAEVALDGLRSVWTPSVTAVWQQGSNRTTGQPLPLIAPFVAQAGLRWTPRGSRLWSEWQSRLVKGGDRVPVGENPIPGFAIFAWRSGYELTRVEGALPVGVSSINLHFGIENLANRLYRGLFEGVPQPGREFRFAIDFNFDSAAR